MKTTITSKEVTTTPLKIKKKVKLNYAVLEYTVKGIYGESLQEVCFCYPENCYEEQGELREEINNWLEEENDMNMNGSTFYSLSNTTEEKAKKKYKKSIISL